MTPQGSPEHLVSSFTSEGEAQIRILRCLTCDTFESVPYDSDPGADRFNAEVLGYAVKSRHSEEHVGMVFLCPEKHWDAPRTQALIIKQIRQGATKGLAEVDDKFYDTKSIFQEDAMQCFTRHLRPKEGCPDYLSDSKRLFPDTRAERKDLGLSPRPTGPTASLCHYCPCKSYYDRKNRGD